MTALKENKEFQQKLDTIQKLNHLEAKELRPLFRKIYPNQSPASVLAKLSKDILQFASNKGLNKDDLSNLYFPRCRKDRKTYLAKDGKRYQGVIVFDNIVSFWEIGKKYKAVVDGQEKIIRCNAKDYNSALTAYCSYLV